MYMRSEKIRVRMKPLAFLGYIIRTMASKILKQNKGRKSWKISSNLLTDFLLMESENKETV